MNRPRQKPNTAPVIEPAMKPAEATSSGVRSAGTPKTVTCETALSWRMPPSRPSRARRTTDAEVIVTGVVQVGVRLGQDLDHVHALEVGGGRDLHAAVQLAVAEVDVRDAADQDRPRVARLQPADDGPGGVDEVAYAHLVGGVDELEQQLAGRGSRTGTTVPGSCEAPAIPPVANSGSVISVTTRAAAGRRLDLADEAGAVDHGIAAVHAVAGALVDLEALVPAVGGADRRRARRPGRTWPSRRCVSISLILPSCWASRSWFIAAVSWLRSLVALGDRLVALALGVDGVAEPAEEVAERLQDAARALLDRRECRQRTALHRVQAAVLGFSVIGGEQDQRGRDERDQHCATASNRSVVHT